MSKKPKKSRHQRKMERQKMLKGLKTDSKLGYKYKGK